MRNLILSFSFVLGIAFGLSGTEDAFAVDSQLTQPVNVKGQLISLDLIDAHREYQAAKLRLQQYRFVSLPQQRRVLDQRLKLAKAEQEILKRRLKDYRPFLEIGDYSPVRTAAESHQLALLQTEQRLQQIQEEQRALLRLNRQQTQLYQLDLLRAVARMSLANQALAESQQ